MESVWQYPRPPRVEDSNKGIEVIYNGVKIAETHRAKRVLETSHPPVYYVPPEDVLAGVMIPDRRTTLCEWKGVASYFSVHVSGRTAENAAWSYKAPTVAYEELTDYVAFYPTLMDQCLVDGETVEAQAGNFYGGWITRDIMT
ncbi:MAG: DUF427 domain-containing protein [Chloroflexota bacterium]